MVWRMVWRMVWPTVWTMVWPMACSVWPLVWTTVWPLVWTTVWPMVCLVCQMVWTMSGQSGQWCPKSVQSGQWWPKSARSGQYLSLSIVGLANACFRYGRSGQYLSWVADFILGVITATAIVFLITKKQIIGEFISLRNNQRNAIYQAM